MVHDSALEPSGVKKCLGHGILHKLIHVTIEPLWFCEGMACDC